MGTRRQIRSRELRVAGLFAAAALLALLLAVAPAQAASRKVAIGDFRWSNLDVQIDLGEKVSWTWVGPDLEHSVTGLSENARGIDSNPGDNLPTHTLGSKFTQTFSTPGVYDFHCKLHALVRGTVRVSDQPGNPALDPDPDPLVFVDSSAPELSDVRFAGQPRVGRASDLLYTLDERSTVEVEVYRLFRNRPSQYRGLLSRKGSIGWNEQRLPAKIRGRKLGAGSYLATVRAVDSASNASRDVDLEFTVRASRR